MATALAEIATSLAGEIVLDRLLPQIVDAARTVTGARYGALGVLADDRDSRDPSHMIVQFVHAGMDPETVARIGPHPTGGGLLGELVRRPELIMTDELQRHPSSQGFPDGHPPMASFLGAPVRAGGRVFGNLYLTEKPGGFDARDGEVITVLAAQAGLAINAAQMAEELRAVAVQDERERISRDLHDGVIQSLFSIGMSLEGARPLVRTDPDRIEARLDGAVGQLDSTIREIRTTIFTLRSTAVAAPGVQSGLVDLAREYEATAALRPVLQLSASLDREVPVEVVPDVLHVVREALSNAAQHARGSRVRIEAEVDDRVLVISVADDGGGFDTDRVPPGHGLSNMAERAAILDAEMSLTSTPGSGTTLTLRVPLDRMA
jgi:signal transduction histidine kinase